MLSPHVRVLKVSTSRFTHLKLFKHLARIQRAPALSQECVSNQFTCNVNLDKFLDSELENFPNKGWMLYGKTIDKPSLTSQQAHGKGKPHCGT